MVPTLHIGDLILVDKFTYGFKIPFSEHMGFKNFLSGPYTPQRGDVVVFKYPPDPGLSYIKRVIGIPGDVVEIKDKELYLNGQKLSYHQVQENDFPSSISFQNLDFYETQIDKKSFLFALDKDNFFKQNHPPTKVPPGNIFVLGDNRDYSHDSRFWDFVPVRNIRGQAILVWLSISLPEGPDENLPQVSFSRSGLSIK